MTVILKSFISNLRYSNSLTRLLSFSPVFWTSTPSFSSSSFCFSLLQNCVLNRYPFCETTRQKGKASLKYNAATMRHYCDPPLFLAHPLHRLCRGSPSNRHRCRLHLSESTKRENSMQRWESHRTIPAFQSVEGQFV